MQRTLRAHTCLTCGRIFLFDEDQEHHQSETGHDQYESQKFDHVINREMVNRLQLSLHEAIISSLNSLGARPRDSIILYLKSKGVMIDFINFDVGEFYAGLEEVIGPAADTILENVIKRLSVQYRINSKIKYEEIEWDFFIVARLQGLLKEILNSGGIA